VYQNRPCRTGAGKTIRSPSNIRDVHHSGRGVGTRPITDTPHFAECGIRKKIGAPSCSPLARGGTHRTEPTARRYARNLPIKKLRLRAHTRFGSLRLGSERRSKADRRSAFTRLSPCNCRSSSDRVSTPLRRSLPERLSTPLRLSSSLIGAMPCCCRRLKDRVEAVKIHRTARNQNRVRCMFLAWLIFVCPFYNFIPVKRA
jgi:hypothetical protein